MHKKFILLLIFITIGKISYTQSNALANEVIKLYQFSNLVLQNSKIKDELWYKTLKIAHNTLRYLKLKGIVNKSAVDLANVNPMPALTILSKIENIDKLRRR